MNDLISRAELFNRLATVQTLGEAYAVIQDMPTAEPKTGEWIPIRKGERGYSAGDFRCSVCHQPNKCYIVTNYCSHCGALMRDK